MSGGFETQVRQPDGSTAESFISRHPLFGINPNGMNLGVETQITPGENNQETITASIPTGEETSARLSLTVDSNTGVLSRGAISSRVLTLGLPSLLIGNINPAPEATSFDFTRPLLHLLRGNMYTFSPDKNRDSGHEVKNPAVYVEQDIDKQGNPLLNVLLRCARKIASGGMIKEKDVYRRGVLKPVIVVANGHRVVNNPSGLGVMQISNIMGYDEREAVTEQALRNKGITTALHIAFGETVSTETATSLRLRYEAYLRESNAMRDAIVSPIETSLRR